MASPFSRTLGRLFGGTEDAATPETPPSQVSPGGPDAASPTETPPPQVSLGPVPQTGHFVDLTRGRSVPYRLYRPKDADLPAPVVLFSHGLGGSIEAAPYLGRALAEAGYWGVWIQHKGSDDTILDGAEGADEIQQIFIAASADPQNMVDRYEDLSFAIDEVERLGDVGGALEGAVLTDRIGIAGHSYGARTVMALAGQAVGVVGAAFKDPRVVAGLALSPSGGRGPYEDDPIPADHFDLIDIPLFHVTGTRDMPFYRGEEFDPFIRTLPFQNIPVDDQYLLVFDGAEHDDFSGTQRGREMPETRYTLILSEVVPLFFDAYLKQSETAWENLRARMPEFLDPVDYFEFR